MHLLISVQTWLCRAELAEERFSVCFCFFYKNHRLPPFQKDQTHQSLQHLCSSVNHPCQRLPGCTRVGTTVWDVYHQLMPFITVLASSTLSSGESFHSEVIVAAMFALASRWGSFHKCLLPSGDYPSTPGPPLSAPGERTSCANLLYSRG